MGGLEVGGYGFVEGFSCRIKDFGEAGLGGGEGVAELYETLGDGASPGAGEADDADSAASGWGGDGDDGVFFKLRYGELGHGKSGGLSYGNWGKNIGVVEGCFCRGFCEK